tara:strand:- start:2898 stop:3989 length:1092 start_codon:yes stop_codon:yes gene_type:complete
MNKAFLFMIMLVSASFVGCIEDPTEDNTVDESSNEDTTQEDETITPVGVDNATNMAPYVAAGVWFSDDDHIAYDPNHDTEAKMAFYVNWAAKDFDGSIDSAGFDFDLDMVIDAPVSDDFGIFMEEGEHSHNDTLIIDNDSWEYDFFNSSGECGFIFHTKFAFIAIDNDGAHGIELVHYVLPASFDYNDVSDTIEEYPGLLGMNQDHLDELNNTDCGYVVPAPMATFFVTQDSANVYHITVVKVSRAAPLEDFMFFLKDESGSTFIGGNGFGEVAMQIQNGEEMGIDMTYDGDDEQLKSRAANVTNDNGAKFPVHFSDNDRDGMLSSGDQFLVYGPDAGPAVDDWKLDIRFDPTEEIIGSAKLM